MCLEDTVRIPLRARDGSIRAHVTIDAADAPILREYVWCMDCRGYAVANTVINGRRTMIYMHRKILGLTPGDGMKADHINRDRLDNRRANLRPVPASGNAQNVSSQRGSSSAYRGVHWDRCTRKWVAQVNMQGKSVSLGYFADEQEAAAVALNARRRLMPYAVD